MNLTNIDASAIEQISDTIVERFHPRRIVLFGSRARGDAHRDSDIDLFIEMDSELSPSERMREVLTLLVSFPYAIDVLVYTPEETARWRDVKGSIVWIAEREGKVVYDSAAPMEIRDRGERIEPHEPWIARADTDFHAIEILVASTDPPWSVVGFHAQQAAEKMIKALLLFHDRLPPRTHNLVALRAALVRIEPAHTILEADCAILTPFAVAARYPVEWEPGETEGRAAVAAAHRIRDAVRSRLRPKNPTTTNSHDAQDE